MMAMRCVKKWRDVAELLATNDNQTKAELMLGEIQRLLSQIGLQVEKGQTETKGGSWMWMSGVLNFIRGMSEVDEFW
jgi:hypothetical protein